MRKTFVIDCFPESVRKYRRGYAIVAIDVIRATTSAITLAALGGRCFPVGSIEAARRLAGSLKDPLLAGELGGERTPGFDLNNSPVELTSRVQVGQSVILLSSSGTKLIDQAMSCEPVYLACFRNCRYTARHLIKHHGRVALIGAGSRGEFRREDQMCCAWIGRELMAADYLPSDRSTLEIVERWAEKHAEMIRTGNSAEFLRRSGQAKDLEFVLAHVNDLNEVYLMKNGEVIAISSQPACGGKNAGAVAVSEVPSTC